MNFNRESKKLFNVVAGGMAVLLISCLANGQATTAPTTGVSKSNILTAVPAEAWGSVVINDLSRTSKTVDGYAVRLGMDPPGLQRRISKMLGMGGKMETSNPMAIVILDKSKYGNQPVGVIMSVKDYEGFATGFGAKATETPGLMKGENEEIGEVYFMKKGPFVVMGPAAAIVTAISGSNQPFSAGLDSSSLELMSGSDVFVRVNFQSLNQFIKPFLTMFSAMAQMGGMGGMGGGEEGAEGQGQNPQMMAQMQMMGALINVLTGVLDELNGLDIGIKLTPDLVRGSSILSFKGGQEVAGLLAHQKATDKPLLKGLPGGGFAAAFGWQWAPKMTKFQESMLQIAPPLGSPADVEKYKKIARESADMVTGTSFKLDIQPTKPGGSMLAVYAVVETKDSKKYVDLMRQSMELQSKMKIPTTKGQEVQMQYKYEPGVAKVGDISVDQYTVDVGKILSMSGGAGGEMEQVKGLLGTLLGSKSGVLAVKIAAVNDKVAVVSVGADASALETFIKTAQNASTPLNDDAKLFQLAKLLPKQRFMEGYLDLSRIVNAGMAIAKTLGDEPEKSVTPPATESAGETSLIGFTGSVAGPTVRMDAVVPFDVVVQVSNVVKPLANKATTKSGIDMNKKIPFKCTACNAVVRFTIRDLQKMQGPGQQGPMMGPMVLDCPKCQKKALTQAVECPKCGEVFVMKIDPKKNLFDDKCPKCHESYAKAWQEKYRQEKN